MTSKRDNALPTSSRRPSMFEMVQVSDQTQKSELEAVSTVDASDFRVGSLNSETVSRAQRLREAVRASGGNKVVSERSGVPGTTLHAYLTGQEMKLGTALALAEACHISLEWLATGNDQATSTAVALSDNATDRILTDASGKQYSVEAKHYTIIPIYHAIGSESDRDVEQDTKGLMALQEAFISQVLRRRQSDLVTITATGDSMEPTVFDGDVLFVDTSVKVIEHSRIYVLDVNGVLVVKRLSVRLDGAIIVRSDNPRYEAETVIPSDRSTLHIIGQVVYQANPPRSAS